jgi:hypothetical protein
MPASAMKSTKLVICEDIRGDRADWLSYSFGYQSGNLYHLSRASGALLHWIVLGS